MADDLPDDESPALEADEPIEAVDFKAIPLDELARHVVDNFDEGTDGSIAIRRLAAALLDPERERVIRHAERLRLADLFESNAGLLNQYAETGPVELVAFLLRLDHG